MSTQLRRFTQSGLKALEEALDNIDIGEDVNVGALVVDPEHTETLSANEIITVQPFPRRFEAAKYLYNTLLPHEAEIPNIDRDKGLWSWLAASWIDVLAPKDSTGRRKLKARARWIPAVDDYKQYYRHLLAGPYRIYRAHHDDPERVMAVLATKVEQPGDVVEQLASRQEIITSPPLMSAITRLYYDPASGTLKRGSATKTGGSSRRLVDVIQQFDLTWDVYGMDPDEFLQLLPTEFDRFLA